MNKSPLTGERTNLSVATKPLTGNKTGILRAADLLVDLVSCLPVC